jgi:hypothetical protein
MTTAGGFRPLLHDSLENGSRWRPPSTEVDLCRFAYFSAIIQPHSTIGDANIGEKVAALMGCDLFNLWSSI